jgi:hypothetical protein
LGSQNYANVNLPVVPTYTSASQIDIFVNCNVEVWLKDIAIQSVGVLHGSSGANAEVMKNPETEAVFTQDPSAGVSSEDATVGEAYFIQEGTSLKVVWSNVINASSYRLIDMNGKIIAQDAVGSDDGTAIFNDLKNGWYSFNILGVNGEQLNVLKIVK